MTNDGPFRKAKHDPSEVDWRPVTRRKQVETDHGPIILYPGEHIELLDRISGIHWGNDIEGFLRRYGNSLSKDDLDVIEEHYPGMVRKVLGK